MLRELLKSQKSMGIELLQLLLAGKDQVTLKKVKLLIFQVKRFERKIWNIIKILLNDFSKTQSLSLVKNISKMILIFLKTSPRSSSKKILNKNKKKFQKLNYLKIS
jgi:hypothetical protein